MYRKWRKFAWPTLAAVFFSMPSFGDVVELTNDDIMAGDGKLILNTDDYGYWGDDFAACSGADVSDVFDPGPDSEGENPGPEFPSFMATTFLHVNPETLGGKVMLSNHECATNNYNANPPDGRGGPADYTVTLVQPNSTGNLPASTDSVFDVTGDDGTHLVIGLTQSVATSDPGPNGEPAAHVDLTYEITNNGSAAVELILIRHIDEDMPWVENATNFWLDDSVGVDFAVLGYPQVYAQDGNVNTASLTLRTLTDPMDDPRTSEFTYYMTKGQTTGGDLGPLASSPTTSGGHPTLDNEAPPCYGDPTCSENALCPGYVAGSDHHYWERPGAPNCWKDYVPGVGYLVAGATEENIDGDSSIGLQTRFSLPVGETYGITYRTSYGFRPIPARFAPPSAKSTLVNNSLDVDGVGEFLFTLKNVNPGGGKAPDPIDVIYVDVEAGLIGPGAAGGDRDAEFTLLRQGWIAENCTGFDANGHAQFRLTNVSGESLNFGDSPFKSRFRIRTNDLTEDTNPETGVIISPLSVVLSFAQDQPDLTPEESGWAAACSAGDYSFGPHVDNGLWTGDINVIAFLRVPSLSNWAKGTMLLCIAACGAALVIRSRREIAN